MSILKKYIVITCLPPNIVKWGEYPEQVGAG